MPLKSRTIEHMRREAVQQSDLLKILRNISLSSALCSDFDNVFLRKAGLARRAQGGLVRRAGGGLFRTAGGGLVRTARAS